MYIQEIIFLFLIAFINIQETSYGSSFPFPLSLLKYEYKLTYMYEHVLFIILLFCFSSFYNRALDSNCTNNFSQH